MFYIIYIHLTFRYCFNDDRVYTISEQDVPGANAYLLFYAREDVLGKDLKQLFPEEGRQAFPVDINQVKRCSWAADLHRASTKTGLGTGERRISF